MRNLLTEQVGRASLRAVVPNVSQVPRLAGTRDRVGHQSRSGLLGSLGLPSGFTRNIIS
jgi:hypothetical protein